MARNLAPDVYELHATGYRNPDQLPDGGVLVVGAGASGLQVAEELLESGRAVHLSVSGHRRMPRRYRGHDLFWWLERWGFLDRTRDEWPDGRMPPSLVVTGVGGGHDIDVRRIRADGAVVMGHLVRCRRTAPHVAEVAEPLVAAADEVHDDFVARAEEEIARLGLDPSPDDRDLAPRTTVPAVPDLHLTSAGVTQCGVVHRYDYHFAHDGPHARPGRSAEQERGLTSARGLYFLGLHWMHTFGSGLFSGVSNDAALLAEHIVANGGPVPSRRYEGGAGQAGWASLRRTARLSFLSWLPRLRRLVSSTQPSGNDRRMTRCQAEPTCRTSGRVL